MDRLDHLLYIEMGVNSLGFEIFLCATMEPLCQYLHKQVSLVFTVAGFSEADSFALLQGSAN